MSHNILDGPSRLPAPGKMVQWAQGSGSGVRSWAYHGIGKVHVMAADGRLTLCGRRPKRVHSWEPRGDDVERHGMCKRCEARHRETVPS